MKYLIINLLIFILLLFLYFIKRHVFPGSILFYEGLIFGALVGILLQILLFFLKIHIPISSGILLFILFISIGPTILDRSVSITVLTSIKSCSDCSTNKIKEQFFKIYFEENKAIEKRLKEQVLSGNVNETNEKYNLSNRGVVVYEFLRYLTTLFNIKTGYFDES